MIIPTKIKSFLWNENLRDIYVIIILVILIRTFVISPYRISGPSMCPTFNAYNGFCNHGKGEYLIVNKFLYFIKEPNRGDIIVFKRPGGEGESFIKRIIAIPGDTLTLDDGYVFIKDGSGDEVQLDESHYLGEENLGNTQAFGGKSEFTVPEDSYFVMGDNRVESLDSRSSFTSNYSSKNSTPFVPKDNIAGKAWIILFPWSEFGFVEKVEY